MGQETGPCSASKHWLPFTIDVGSICLTNPIFSSLWSRRDPYISSSQSSVFYNNWWIHMSHYVKLVFYDHWGIHVFHQAHLQSSMITVGSICLTKPIFSLLSSKLRGGIFDLYMAFHCSPCDPALWVQSTVSSCGAPVWFDQWLSFVTILKSAWPIWYF